MEIWIDRSYVPAGYGWSFPASDEIRVGVGSFDPRFHVKEPTVRLADDLERDAVRYQGNWIPHRLRPAAADGVFFVGDSAGHCLPLTAEGIRTAFYFGIACADELREVIAGRATREDALRRYAAFSASHRWKFEAMLRTQRVVPRVPPRLLALALRGMSTGAFVRWSFGHYLEIAPPSFARERARPRAVVSRGTLPDQRVVGAPLAGIPEAAAAAALPGPALLVVGDVVRLSDRIAWFGADRAATAGEISHRSGRVP